MNLIDLLKEEEIDAITARRKAYGYSEEFYDSKLNFVDTKIILEEWANKKKNLYTWLGNNLTISKEFEYTKSIDQITTEMNEYMYNEKTKDFRTSYNRLLWASFDADTEWKMRELISTESLANNTYIGSDFTIEFPNGRTYRVTKGCKAIKALGKIAEGFKLEGFEEFRIAHSQTLNQKKLKGELVLSIHPIDFITMSDNDCGWSTCMSWEEYGEYRRGTVEMMNSPKVIIAYLKSSEDMRLENGYTCSNKKWRQLFVVDPNVIASIKEYPYYNKEITNAVLNWLKELAKLNLGINFMETQEYCPSSTKFNLPHLPKEKNNFYLQFYANTMYNDFGRVPDCHYVAFNEAFDSNIISIYSDPKVEINYSGMSQCMICSDLAADFYNESALACNACEEYFVCDYCGEKIYGESYYVNGHDVCYHCYEEHSVECSICEELHMTNDDAINLTYAIPRLSKEEQLEVYKYGKDKCYYSYKYNEDDLYGYISRAFSTYVCDYFNCQKTFEEKYLVEGAFLKKRQGIYFETQYYVFFDELNDEGKELFNIYTDVHNNEQFKQCFSNYHINRI